MTACEGFPSMQVKSRAVIHENYQHLQRSELRKLPAFACKLVCPCRRGREGIIARHPIVRLLDDARL